MDRLPREGWEALAAADWPTARRSFEHALAESETAEALDGLSQALHFQREYDAAIEVKERAFAAYRREGRPADAADTARWLAFLHGTYLGNFAAASGWMGRAQSLLEDVEECAAPKLSYSLSARFVKPDRPPPCRSVRMRPRRLVKIL